MSTPFAIFGPGIVIVSNLSLATPAPVNIGYAQEFSIDLSATNKDLFGQNKFPLVRAQGTIKATGKVKAAVCSGLAWNAAFFGQTFASGGFAWNVDEPHTPAAVTQQVTNHSNFDADLGVRYAASNLPLQRVAAGAETTGAYSVSYSTGTYTFAAADETGLLFTYTSTTAAGQNLMVKNQQIGVTPVFQLDYYNSLNQPTAKPFAVRLFQCVADKLALAGKLEDFLMPEIDFGFFANAAGNVMEMVTPEVS